MKRTALILAGAVAFDLGVMVVAAQAQQQAPTAPVPSGPAAPVPDPTGGYRTAEDLARAQQAPSAQVEGRTHKDHKGETAIYIKMDRVNTIQACNARQGQVVMHEGAQQCRLPNPSSSSPVTGRPGGIPPRN